MNTETKKYVRTLVGHSESVNSVAISPDSKYIVSGSGSSYNSNNNTIKIWNFESG